MTTIGYLKCAAPGTSLVFELARPFGLLGSSHDADYPLADSAVSRCHAEITVRAGRFELRDLGSTNGTIVNGRSVSRTTLQPGDLILVGHTELEFSLDAPARAASRGRAASRPRVALGAALVAAALGIWALSRRPTAAAQEASPTTHSERSLSAEQIELRLRNVTFYLKYGRLADARSECERLRQQSAGVRPGLRRDIDAICREAIALRPPQG